MWLSLVERCVRDAEVAGSNPVIPTKFIFRITTDFPRCYAEFLCFAFAQKHTFKRKKAHKKVVKLTAHFCIEKSEQAIHSLFRRGNASHKDICAEGALAKRR